jgi:valyl-tRNA synthetase
MGLPKSYEPNKYEKSIYDLWEKNDAFSPRGTGKSYSVVIPPPNANGDLHIGHALTFGLEDVITRYHRMKGDKTLLLPGADHAGFETWVVFEKQLAKTGKSRYDFSREELYSQVWDFVAKNRLKFEAQLRRLGLSVDWRKFTFTLDQKIVDQAYSTFKSMWQNGLIYRGERLVNFCTLHGTAFADIEVLYKQEKGKLWYVKYPLTDGEGPIVIATTRPETMLGDAAVAVHPDDKRYRSLIGKTVRLPLTNREIPVIQDSFVDPKFGTGAVKITPAHDLNDFEAGKRHDLPLLTVINHEGKIADEVPSPYRGMKVKEARKAVVQDLEEQGLIEKIETISHSVGHCYKCDTVIEPLLKEQWFVDMKPLAEKAIKALSAGSIEFYPKSKKSQLLEYLSNLKDWNISRQIPWGIPIPAFQNIDEPDDWIYDEHIDEELIKIGSKTYKRDPDVFDTWFSSSSWPYATLGYPNSPDYESFYPLNLMETGGEILYPWVSRMIMLGLYVTGSVPFKAVYVHGYVMAEDGAKMSKSLGNVINPIEIIDQYGSDALRIGIISGRVPAVNRGYDHRKVEAGRNFCNKLWNIARFVELAGGRDEQFNEPKAKNPQDYWILDRLDETGKQVSVDLEKYRFAEAFEKLYHFIWDDFADWYIESAKTELNIDAINYTLEQILIMSHPFAPFVTEAIWQNIYQKRGTLLINQAWPKAVLKNDSKSAEFNNLKNIISEIRNLLKEMDLKNPTLVTTDKYLLAQSKLIKQLSGIAEVNFDKKPSSGLKLIHSDSEAWLIIESKSVEKYIDKLKSSLKAQEHLSANLRTRLKNKKYLLNAPKSIITESNSQLNAVEDLISNLKAEQKRFEELTK